jgi:peptide deformylase
MALDIRTFGDPVLKTRAAPVESFDDALAHLAEEMLATMREREGVGLAANQVGRLKRILVVATEDEEYVIVNPVIEEVAETAEKELEGCLSIPGIQVEVLARIFQHEIDHLDGVLILDRTDRESRKVAMREMRERLLAQS